MQILYPQCFLGSHCTMRLNCLVLRWLKSSRTLFKLFLST
uniref:Uncharacterized protein n=1 Tax=Anguilla anguilla TaxID=7936 RepID=A0A0E9R8Q3_ANGAN